MKATRDVQASMFPDIKPHRPVGYLPPSIQAGTNADIIASVAPLYLSGDVLDVTYGKGNWWTRHRPESLTYHDLHKVDGVDFTDLPHPDGSFDAVCFDPPYIVSGGESATRGEFQNAYGIGSHNLAMTNSQGGNDLLHGLIRGGLTECIRVSRTWVLVKCMEFSQGEGVHNTFGTDFHDMPYAVTTWALDAGCIKHDQIVHCGGTGPGGHNIFTPKRARRHHSYLIVFRKQDSAT